MANSYPSVDANTQQAIYNNPQYTDNQANPSSVGKQIRLDVYEKQALLDIVKEQYFSQLADTTDMPKNMGKTIKKFHWLPLLDDRNVNDQGLDAAGASYANGNLYGSSKDIGAISGKMPTLTEVGGRVNRVGFTRKVIEGSIHKMGFFYEFTEEALNFDTEAELMSHMVRESMRGANELTEDQIQLELLQGAGVMVYTGTATSKATMSAEGAAGTESLITYKDIQRLSVTLDENRCPKSTKIITGSRMIDTKTINSARVMFIGSELENQFRNMLDAFNNPAFIPVEKYADAGTLLNGEIGAISQFRIVVVQEMMHWEAAGVTAVNGLGVYRTGAGNKYNVYPALVVGSEAFTNIGFQTSGANKKWKITTKLPGADTADRTDPYGETGFSSIKWYHGMLIQRPEWIAVLHSLAVL